MDHLGYRVQEHVQRLELKGKYCSIVVQKRCILGLLEIKEKEQRPFMPFLNYLTLLWLKTTVLERKKVIRAYRSHPISSAILTQSKVARVRRRGVSLGTFVDSYVFTHVV